MATMIVHETDVVVVGGGGAALRAALEARRAGARVLLVTKESASRRIISQCDFASGPLVFASTAGASAAVKKR